jgi:hypothetical protein
MKNKDALSHHVYAFSVFGKLATYTTIYDYGSKCWQNISWHRLWLVYRIRLWSDGLRFARYRI